MFCVKCGTELPDDANYCLKCGHPQKAGLNQTSLEKEPTAWEQCKLKLAMNYKRTGGWLSTKHTVVGNFTAVANSPAGKYDVAKSTEFSYETDENPSYLWWSNSSVEAAVEQLERQLFGDGWQLLPTDKPWIYENRIYQRPFKSK